MQITIDEYAARYKMSKEMIRAKLRAGRLPYTEEGGVIYITVEDAPRRETPEQQKAPARQHSTAGAIIMMYQKENTLLKQKIAELEAKIDRLIADKEQMLRDERDRIETVYAKRDEQLKSFLELVNAKLVQESFKLAGTYASETITPAVDTPAEAPSSPAPKKSTAALPERTELLRFLEENHYTEPQIKTVKKRFAKAYGNDIRVNQQNGEFILDFSKYDYSDLLSV